MCKRCRSCCHALQQRNGTVVISPTQRSTREAFGRARRLGLTGPAFHQVCEMAHFNKWQRRYGNRNGDDGRSPIEWEILNLANRIFFLMHEIFIFFLIQINWKLESNPLIAVSYTGFRGWGGVMYYTGRFFGGGG